MLLESCPHRADPEASLVAWSHDAPPADALPPKLKSTPRQREVPIQKIWSTGPGIPSVCRQPGRSQPRVKDMEVPKRAFPRNPKGHTVLM